MKPGLTDSTTWTEQEPEAESKATVSVDQASSSEGLPTLPWLLLPVAPLTELSLT